MIKDAREAPASVDPPRNHLFEAGEQHQVLAGQGLPEKFLVVMVVA